MTTFLRSHRLPRFLRQSLLLLVLMSMPATQLQAAEPVTASRAPIAGLSLNWPLVQRLLGNRQAMLQFGAVGMIFGLWILMKK